MASVVRAVARHVTPEQAKELARISGAFLAALA
jgi:hypothetical protein